MSLQTVLQNCTWTLGAAQIMLGLELSCGVLVGSKQEKCAAGNLDWDRVRLGGSQGVMRASAEQEHLKEILIQRDGQAG